MESTLAWTGLWTSILVSGLVVITVLIEFCKRNLPICFGLLATLLTIYCLTPYSAGARQVWSPLNKVQVSVTHAVQEFFNPSHSS
ncbi:hypothetical protein EMOOHJMP_00051 [Microcystis phage MaAM05]|nr:hypothetical protein EMOOHJMP_00051 [Microcystis phage MaAM05]